MGEVVSSECVVNRSSKRMFVCLLELSVGGKTDDTENGRDNYKRIPKSVRRDVHKGKSWP